MGKNSQYGVILDAGSSGTRMYVYKWHHPLAVARNATATATAISIPTTTDLQELPKLKLKRTKKTHPGVSTFVDKVAAVGPDHLQPLLNSALSTVPVSKINDTPIFLLATAGVRFLPKKQQTELLQSICDYLRTNTRFQLPDCQSRVQVIFGETEGLYGWIAANYLLGGFDRPDEHDHGKGHHTYGFLDMGGASAQIAFAPNVTEANRHANDLKLVRMRRLDGSSLEYKVFTTTWLGFGANKARSRYLDNLLDQYDSSVDPVPDPCLPRGLRTSLNGDVQLHRGAAQADRSLIGTGEFAECLRRTHTLLGKDVPCEQDPCLLNGQRVPAIDFDVNHFVGVSEFWHTTHGVFSKSQSAYDLATYQHTVLDFCSRKWSDIEPDLNRRRKTPEQRKRDAQEACFKASWLINVLHDGIGIPRVSLEHVSGGKTNTTKHMTDKAKEKGFLDPFQPVDKIDGVEVSWTLGKMVLYATGQVLPRGRKTLPVGFGSNVPSGLASDFEHAGSTPLLPISKAGEEMAAESHMVAGGAPVSGLLVVICLLLLALCMFRKPERMRYVLSMLRRRRRPGAALKPFKRGPFSFTSKLFGPHTPTYDRIMDEEEAADFELGDVDSDDYDSSDRSESSKAGNASNLPKPRINVDAIENLQPTSTMDRRGLAVRTESRERLTPAVQMLNVGRRSRATSPTRSQC